MEIAEKIFVEKLESLSKSLDSISLYITDLAMIIVNEQNLQITDLEILRKAVINNDVELYLDIECIAGNNAWRDPQLFDNISYGDIESYFE